MTLQLNSPLVDECLAALRPHDVLHSLPERVGLALIRGVEAGVRRGGVDDAADAEPEGDDRGDVRTHGVRECFVRVAEEVLVTADVMWREVRVKEWGSRLGRKDTARCGGIAQKNIHRYTRRDYRMHSKLKCILGGHV